MALINIYFRELILNLITKDLDNAQIHFKAL